MFSLSLLIKKMKFTRSSSTFFYDGKRHSDSSKSKAKKARLAEPEPAPALQPSSLFEELQLSVEIEELEDNPSIF